MKSRNQNFQSPLFNPLLLKTAVEITGPSLRTTEHHGGREGNATNPEKS